MGHLTNHKLHRLLTRFPWRRRKPRTREGGPQPVPLTTPEGRQLWADPELLAGFEDPTPAMVYVAIRKDDPGRQVVRALVRKRAADSGIELPDSAPEATLVGLDVLRAALESSDLDGEQQVGDHALEELLTATWAIASTDPGPEA